MYGYYLGISDKHNAAQFGLERTVVVARWRLIFYFLTSALNFYYNFYFYPREVMERVLKPCMLHVTKDTIVMAQKIFANPLTYYVWVYRNYRMVGFELSGLWSSFTWRQRWWYYVRTVFMEHFYSWSLVKYIINSFVKKSMDKFFQVLPSDRNKQS